MKDSEINPGKIMQTASAYWQSLALHAAVKLDLFTILSEGHIGAAEVAARIGGDGRATATLLNALTAMGLLEKDKNTFSCTELSNAYLSRKSPSHLSHIIIHLHHLVDSWRRLDEAVLTGRPTRPRSSIRGEKEREAFLMGMFNAAMGIAPHAVKKIDLTGRKFLLDMGGGPGTWAIHFCLANPDLRATVFDLPETKPFAEKTITRFGLNDRILFRGGDYLKEEIEEGYDVAWLSQVLHGEGPDACRNMIRKAVAALLHGGLILVHDLILNNDMAGPLQPALFSLNMLTGTDEGRSYSEQQIMDMMREAGAEDIKRLPFHHPGETGIVMGIKP
ncbi:MAG: SAM-dependent methyltransferase [Desulfobacteraceae bacterium]|nr:MAG: SAM-dependent methyltransferase [Desulfobacteraceae bacterium]